MAISCHFRSSAVKRYTKNRTFIIVIVVDDDDDDDVIDRTQAVRLRSA